MARQETVTTIDDLDGTHDATGTLFGIDGRSYEIDLAPANRDRLDKALAPFIAAARRGGRTTARTTAAPPRRQNTEHREQNQAIRDWAYRRGMKIADRGRIPAHIATAYHQENTGAVTRPATETTAAADVPAPRAEPLGAIGRIKARLAAEGQA